MYISDLRRGLTIGELLFQLRVNYKGVSADLYKAIKMTSATYLKVERGERELSLLMTLRLCTFYKLDLHEFISMLSDEELGREDYSILRHREKIERKRREMAQAKIIDIKTQSASMK